MILVDTSVIADVLTKDPDWFGWSSGQIERWGDAGPVCHDTVVFGANLSSPPNLFVGPPAEVGIGSA